MTEYIKTIYFERNFESKNFEMVYTAALKRLHKEGMLIKIYKKGQNYYRLTQKGYENVKSLLDEVIIEKRDRKINEIRLELLKIQYC